MRGTDIIAVMVRTIISLDPEDKAWLDRAAKRERVPMTQLVRRAVKRMRQESETTPSRFEILLEKTKGIGKGRFGDGLAYQRRIRREWDRR